MDSPDHEIEHKIDDRLMDSSLSFLRAHISTLCISA